MAPPHLHRLALSCGFSGPAGSLHLPGYSALGTGDGYPAPGTRRFAAPFPVSANSLRLGTRRSGSPAQGSDGDELCPTEFPPSSPGRALTLQGRQDVRRGDGGAEAGPRGCQEGKWSYLLTSKTGAAPSLLQQHEGLAFVPGGKMNEWGHWEAAVNANVNGGSVFVFVFVR